MKIKNISGVFLIFLAMLVALITLISSYRLRVYFPATDLQTNSEFLFNAALSGLEWDIFSLHNGIHWIVVPKAIFSLDMYFFEGEGWLTIASSLLCIIVCFFIFLKKLIKESSIDILEKYLFGSLILAMFFGSWMLESTNNQINLQWTSLMMSIALMANSLDFYKKNKSPLGLLEVFLFGLLLLMCAGQPVALLLAVLVAYVFSVKTTVKIVIGCFITVFLTVESIALLINLLDLSAIFTAYISPEHPIWGVLKTIAESGIFNRWILFFADILFFVAKFYWPIFHGVVAVEYLSLVTIVMIFMLVFCWIKSKQDVKGRFWLFCIVFCAVTAVLAAIIRTSNGYSIRFSGLGIVLLVSSIIYLRVNAAKYHAICINLLAGSLVIILPYLSLMALETYANSASAAGTAKSQLAYSMGIKESKLIVNRPGAWWQETDAEQIRAFVPNWEQLNIGIFGSSDYSIYQTQRGLPDVEVNCQYIIDKINYYPLETELVVYLTGSVTAEKRALDKLLFYSDDLAVGWAKQKLGGSWQDILLKPATWEGFVRLPNHLANITSIEAQAYTSEIRCNKFLIELKH